VVQKRGDYGEPRVNFTASWQQYKDGFGELQVLTSDQRPSVTMRA
jgi:hypothetical protein